MSEERLELESGEDKVTNRKKKKKIVAIIITVIVLLIVVIGMIVLQKYKEEHRYIPFAELNEETIVFVREYINEVTIGWTGYFVAYDISGRKYRIEYYVEEYGQIAELRKAIISGEADNNNLIQVEMVENYVLTAEMEQMYGNLLQINRRAKYRMVSERIIMDAGETCFYGVRFLQNGEVEYVKMWCDSEATGKDLLDDPYAIDICNWMMYL